jgi:hypothetical protein
VSNRKSSICGIAPVSVCCAYTCHWFFIRQKQRMVGYQCRLRRRCHEDCDDHRTLSCVPPSVRIHFLELIVKGSIPGQNCREVMHRHAKGTGTRDETCATYRRGTQKVDGGTREQPSRSTCMPDHIEQYCVSFLFRTMHSRGFWRKQKATKEPCTI